MSYYMYVGVLNENVIILGNLYDLLCVCVSIVWIVASQLNQVRLRITFGRRISCSYVWCPVIVC